MNRTSNQTEELTIEKVANRYKKRGYDVKLYPEPRDLPPFLKRYRPDLIVTNNKEKVVVELKSRSEIVGSSEIKNMAKAVQARPGWRFELGFIKSGKVSNDDLVRASIGYEDVMQRVSVARELASEGNVEAAILTAWSAAEVVLRRVARVQDINIQPFKSAAAIKGLYSFGVIGWRDYEFLHKNYETRNHIAHGFRRQRVTKQTVFRLLKLIEKLLPKGWPERENGEK